MLKSIDLSKVPVEYRRYLLEEDPLFSKSFEMFRLLSLSVMDAQNIAPKNLGAVKCLYGIVVFDKISGHLHSWNLKENIWTQMQEMNADMKNGHFSAVAVENHIYVLMEKREVYSLNYSNRTANWERMADMIEQHGWFPAAVVLSGDIHVISGHHCFPTGSVEKFQPVTNQWTRIADIPRPTKYTALLSTQGQIYGFGGFVDGKFTKEVGKFDTNNGTCTKMTPMNKPRGCMGVVRQGSKIYVLGGSLPGNSVTPRLRSTEVYDTITHSWTSLKEMTICRSCHRGFAIGGNIYAVGG